MGSQAEQKIDEEMQQLEEKLANCKSHVASMDIMRKLDELKKKKENLSKGWITG